MTTLVTDNGFSRPTGSLDFKTADEIPANDGAKIALDLASDADPSILADRLSDISIIRVDFPNFADGRGMTIARRLRLMGFVGTLRAKGHIIADQYAMARRSGFDEVEIDDELAARQPEEQWLDRANWKDHDYQSRLRG